MNRQEVFNKIYNHLLTQNQKSALEDDTCLYRGPNGTKCAIGCLIPDELYKPEFEGMGTYQLFQEYPKLAQHLEVNDHIDECFLSNLQSIHDTYPPEEWPIKLATHAANLGVQVPNEHL